MSNNSNQRAATGLQLMPLPMRWVAAARLKTLGLSLTPVLAGTWLAARDGTWSLATLVFAAVAAISIQVGTNLWNDAADAERGTDASDRLGPPRLTALGLLDGADVKKAAFLTFLLAALCGAYLASIGGWPIIVIGLVSLSLGYAYSMGPLPLAGTPLGEILVIGFFGVIAVMTTAYLQGLPPTFDGVSLGVLFGLPSAAVLLLNNHRDRTADARSGRKTLAILLGETGARGLYTVLLLAAVALLTLRGWFCPDAIAIVLAVTAAAVALIVAMWRTPVSSGINRLLPLTSLFQFGLLAALVLTPMACG